MEDWSDALRAYERAAEVDAQSGGGKIAKALASPAILESAEREVLESLLLACQVFVEKARELEGEAVEKLIQCCVFLMGADINFDLREDTEELLEDLSGGNVPGLLEKCFVKLVQMLKGEDEAPVWTSAKNPKLRGEGGRPASEAKDGWRARRAVYGTINDKLTRSPRD